MKTAALALLLGALDCVSATGGTLQVTVPLHHAGYPGAPPSTTVMSAPLSPKPLVAGQWSVTPPDTDTVLAPLSIGSAPSGNWVGSTLTFDVPYFAARSGRLVLAAPAVDDSANAPSTAEFVRDASAMPALEDVFLLNARAHRIWDGRRTTIGAVAMGQEDAKVVFWLLQTESTLVEQTHLEIDGTVRSAMDWMRAATSDPRQVHLFALGGVRRADALAVLAQLDARDTQLYSLVLNRLSTDVGSADEAIRKDACMRIKTMVDFYSSMHDGGAPSYPKWERHELIATTRLADCAGQTVTAKLRLGEKPAAEDLQAATTVAGRLDALAAHAAESPGKSLVVRQAKDRAAELRALTPIS